MKRCRSLLACAAVLWLLSPAAAAVIAKNDKDVRAIAEPILDTVLTGLNEGNYGLYSRHFDPTLKEAIPEKEFLRVRANILKKLGKYQSSTYLGFVPKGNFTMVLWRGRFSAADDSVLIKLVLTKRGNKVLVTGLWFQ